ncbi:MAG: gluconate transporter [Bacteroidetes bacterium QS_3_64_15]|nr:MAG: gluconate transporter [Bacteroidetes bacterium QS_3_64_15]
MSPLALAGLVLCAVALLLVLVLYVRLHAFVALLLTSLLVALLGGIPLADIVEVIEDGMGSTLGYIATVIGLGAMVGEMLRQSGGAEEIAATLLRSFGDDRTPWALSLTGLLVAIPVFFDVALILFIPLVYTLTERTGKSLLYYAIPLLAGIAVAHSFIPPTPGPVAVAGLLDADLGWVIFFGILAGIPSILIGGVFFGHYIAGQIHLDVPDVMREEEDEIDVDVIPPSFGQALAVIGLPLGLILLGTLSEVVLAEGTTSRQVLELVGHPFTALMGAAVLAFYVLGVRGGMPMEKVQTVATKALEPVGLIILVTGAGGVLGNVLVETGVGDALAEAMAASNLPVVLLAFLIAVVVRVSQGSATVSMVTAAGLVAPVIEAGDYSEPMTGLVTISIAAGATVLSHVNDSGFWLVGRFLGMDEQQTLRSWTVMETIVGTVGFLVALGISALL